MTYVAVVTGGTRGIGAAISRTLRNAGMTVAANYCGNDDGAMAFSERTGIAVFKWDVGDYRSEEHTSELQSLMRISYAVFCLKKKTQKKDMHINTINQYKL